MWRACLFVGAIALALSDSLVVAGNAGKPATLDNDPNLVGWWRFDETAGGTAMDSSGHKRNGTLSAGLTFDKNSASGKVGQAIRFDAKNALIEVKDYKGIGGTRARTVTAWIKTSSAQGEIVSWGKKDFGQMFTLGYIRGRVGVTPSGGYLYMNAETHDDKWHHIAVVVQRAELPNLHDDVKLYLDGAPAEIHDIGLLDLWPIQTGQELPVRIGRGFKGLVDDLRIYDRVLSEEEINAIFQLKTDRPLPKAK
jgi:Concanavalin A-like lectin/glucanases superfamily